MGNDEYLGFDAEQFTESVDTDRLGPESQALYDFLTGLVIGQDRAARLITRSLASRAVGLSDPERPEIIVCPGPSGSGKTYSAEVVARCLIYDDEVNPPFLKVDCSELTEHHQLSELRGSPPGYVGFGETPRLAQIKLDEPHVMAKLRQFIREHPEAPAKQVTDKAFLANFYLKNGPYTSVICFDEFEKGCVALHHLLYGILDKGQTTMARGGEVTSFRNSIIFLTTNVGDRDIFDILSGQNRPIGFARGQSAKKQLEDAGDAIYEMTLKKMKEIFPGPLIGRMRGRIVVFRPLNRDDLQKILDLMIARVMKRLRGSVNPTARQLQVAFSTEFREFVIDEGTSPEFGARELRSVVERHVACKLANAIENGEAKPGDVMLFTVTGEGHKRDSALLRMPRSERLIPGVLPAKDGPSRLLPPPVKVPSEPDKTDPPDDPPDKLN